MATTPEEIIALFMRVRDATTKAPNNLKPAQIKRVCENAVEAATSGTQAIVVAEIAEMVCGDPGDEDVKYWMKKHFAKSSFQKIEQAKLRDRIADMIADVEAEEAEKQAEGGEEETGGGEKPEGARKTEEDAGMEKPAASKASAGGEPAKEKTKEEETLFVPELDSE